MYHTHRVELNRLYDHINLDPMIHVKHVNTTRQLAEIFTNGYSQETDGHN